jgi:hypothetical protein
MPRSMMKTFLPELITVHCESIAFVTQVVLGKLKKSRIGSCRSEFGEPGEIVDPTPAVPTLPPHQFTLTLTNYTIIPSLLLVCHPT